MKATENKFNYFVCMDHKTTAERRAAALWAITQFGNNVNVWVLGKNQESGFWFKHEKDAVWFTLKWV